MPRPKKGAGVGSLDDISRRRVRLTKMTVQVPEDLHNDLMRMVELAKQVDREIVLDELITDFLTDLRDRYLPAFEDQSQGVQMIGDDSDQDEAKPALQAVTGGQKARTPKAEDAPLAQQGVGSG